jgi:pimeloyl-ACP methyl ester carboxylesterase
MPDSGGFVMIRSRFLLAVSLLLAVPLIPAQAPAAPVKEAVSFTVTNPLRPLKTWTVKGWMIRPAAGCTRSVLLAMHGLSYGEWAWDFPGYSVARALAARGYAMVAVDELGYGSSAGGKPNGYTLTVDSYADMAAQMAKQLRRGTYHAASPVRFAHVGLIGHSAGSEIIEMAASLHPGIADVLIPTAYTHEPFVNNYWLRREWTQDNIRAAMDDYEYFETNPQIRARDMYNRANADPAVIALDNSKANLTPSGEILSIGTQRSRLLLGTIRIPVLLVLGEKDTLFPGHYADQELLLFTLASDKSSFVAPNDGHTFMTHYNAAVTNSAIADWLDARNAKFPKC